MKGKLFVALSFSCVLSGLLLYHRAGGGLGQWKLSATTERVGENGRIRIISRTDLVKGAAWPQKLRVVIIYIFHRLFEKQTDISTPDNVTVVPKPSKAGQLEKCPNDPPELVGPLRIVFDEEQTLEEIAKLNAYVTFGGRYKPMNCTPLQRIAIIIPFRNRDHHLRHWLYYLLPILRRQQGDVGIYVIEQAGDGTFNRAKLLNVGFAEALKENEYDCFIFSDVDIIPENDRNLYRCSANPRHLACAMDKFNYRLPYSGYFGGVVAFTKEQYLKINGFSNNYWGWGTEDDDTYMRVKLNGMTVDRPDSNIARTKMIRHERDKGNEVNEKNYVVYNRMKFTRHHDGYKSLKYSVTKIEKTPLFTKITVDIGKPS